MPSRGPDGRLIPTPLSELLLMGLMAGVVVHCGAWLGYGAFPPITLGMGVIYLVLAVLCVGLTLLVRASLRGRFRIGLDPSQLNPVTLAWCAAYGGASAYFGALTTGAALGLEAYLLPKLSTLAAASADQPGVLVVGAAALFLAVAGVALERSCILPPGESSAPTAA